MWTTDDNHGAQTQFHTGRHMLDGEFPTLGAWVHYGLGLAQRQPAAVRLDGQPRVLERQGRPLPRPGARRGAGARRSGQPARLRQARSAASRAAEQKAGFELVGKLNQLRGDRVPGRPGARRPGSRATNSRSGCRSRCRRCSTSPNETAETKKLYGLDRAGDEATSAAAAGRAAARRARRAVRPGSARGRRRGRVGRARRPEGEPREELPRGRSADRRAAQRPEAHAGCSNDTIVVFATRVRPHAGHAGQRRPRPSHLRLQRLDGRRRAEGRRSSTARPTRSASTPSRTGTTSPTSTRRSCTSSGSTRASSKSPAASGSTSTTATPIQEIIA